MSVAFTVAGCEATSTTPSEVASAEVTPAATTIVEGQTVQLQVRLEDASGNEVTGRTISWSVDAPSVATVDANGLVRGLAPGAATVTAATEGISATADVMVLSRASIVLDRSEAGFKATRDGADPPPEAVQITNGGDAPLLDLTTSVTFLAGAGGWLTTSLGSTEAPSTLTLSASVLGLGSGTYLARVDVGSSVASNSPAAVAVSFDVVEPPPLIGLSADRVELEAPETSQTPVPALVGVANAGGGTLTGLEVTIDYPQGQATGWLAVTLAGATAPTTIQMAATPDGLAPGVYEATVVVSASAALNTPQAVTVVFTIVPRSAGARQQSAEAAASGR